MSTRCVIGYENKDGSFTFSYCHHDGYVEKGVGVGYELVTSYNSHLRAQWLVNNGNMSSIITHLGKNEQENRYEYLHTPDYYSPKEPTETVTDLKNISYGDIEFIYIFTLNGKWEYCDLLSNNHTWDIKNYSRHDLLLDLAITEIR